MVEGSVLGEAGSTVVGTGNAGGTPAPQSAGESSGAPANWRDTLPEDIRANPSISSFTDVAALTKSYIHAQSVIGKKGVIVPTEKSTPEDWKSFYQQIGVPAADKYDVKAPDGYPVPEETMKWFKETALAEGLLPKQAAGFLSKYAEYEKAALAKAETSRKENMEAGLASLKKEWGEGYDKELNAARVAVKHAGGDDLLKHLNATGMANDPTVIKALAKMARWLGEDTLRGEGAGSGASTPTDIHAAIAELRGASATNGLYDTSHPNHKAATDKLANLYQQLTRGK